MRLFDRLPPTGRPFDVVAFGENSWDVLATVPHWPAPDEKLELVDLMALPGGQAASAAVGCARLGCRTRYLGVFGDDEQGRLVENALLEEGVETDGCETARAANRSAFIVIDSAAATRAVLWRRDKALEWSEPKTLASLVADGRVLLIDTTDLEAAIAAADAARAAQIPVVLDVDQPAPGLERLLQSVDVLIAAQGFPQAFTGQSNLDASIRSLHDRFGSAVVVTLGPSGAIAWDGASTMHSPAYVVPVVDPTGAGDAFRAGFIGAWLQGASSLAEAMDFANATAALACRAVGAQAGLPSLAEVRALLTDRDVRRSNQAGFVPEAGRS
jgi:sulfofructose kinase